jgi:hypothetical protein
VGHNLIHSNDFALLMLLSAGPLSITTQTIIPTEVVSGVTLFGTTPTEIAALRSLQARVQASTRSIAPAIVAVKDPGIEDADSPLDDQPRRFQHYASGVIITADGIVLSQFHVSRESPCAA